MSDVDIRIRTRAPTGGTCVANSGTVGLETWDLGADVKSMAALESSSLGGKCAEVDILTTNVSATYGVTAWHYCYTAGVSDDEPN